MKILAFVMSCLFSFPCLSSAKQPSKRYLFVEWQHWDSTIVLGELTGEKFKHKILLTSSLQKLKSADVSNWLGETGNEEVLLFFHAMWGQQVNFHRKTLRSIEKILDSQPDNGIHTVISFIWHAGGLLYRHNAERAFGKGEPLGTFLAWIRMHYSNKVNVLCHSMGNRFFEGMLPDAIEECGKSKLFGSIILFSPDLDAKVDDLDFQRLFYSAEGVEMLMHRRDRLLLISCWLLGRERLGRSGPIGDIDALYSASHLLVIDMTEHTHGLLNHTHLDKSWVQEEIREVLER